MDESDYQKKIAKLCQEAHMKEEDVLPIALIRI